MKKALGTVLGLAIFCCSAAFADETTEREVIDTLMAANAYTKETLKGRAGDIATEGSLEFWSSGGLLQQLAADIEAQEFDKFSLNIKHITVATLVPGKAAVAQYYSEGSMSPKGTGAVQDYRVRVTQVLVKEDGKWKIRAAHFSPIAGGSGTSQTSVDD